MTQKIAKNMTDWSCKNGTNIYAIKRKYYDSNSVMSCN